MATIIKYERENAEEETISEFSLRAIENSDLDIHLRDYNKFDVLVEFDDGESEVFTFQVSIYGTHYVCPSCDKHITLFDPIRENTIKQLVKNILEHRRNCLALKNLESLQKEVIVTLTQTDEINYYAIAASIYYLAEVIRRGK